MSYRFSLGEQVKPKEACYDHMTNSETKGTVIDRWTDAFNRKLYKVKIESENYSYNQFYREDELNSLWDIHGVNKIACECGAVKTLNPLNHSQWCPLAKVENDN